MHLPDHVVTAVDVIAFNQGYLIVLPKLGKSDLTSLSKVRRSVGKTVPRSDQDWRFSTLGCVKVQPQTRNSKAMSLCYQRCAGQISVQKYLAHACIIRTPFLSHLDQAAVDWHA